MLTDSSKGMPTVTVIVGLVSTLLVGSAILGSLQAIKTTSLDPNVDQTQNQLEQVGDKTITIVGSDADIARQQMQGAIVWNMLAASDCRVLTTFNALSRAQKNEGQTKDGERIDFDEGSIPISPVGDKVFKATSSDFLSELANNNGNGYTGNFNDFMPLIESGFDYPCVGTQSTIKAMEDAAKKHSNNLVSGLFSGAYKVVGAGLVIAGAGACVLTAGAACVAVAGGAAMLVGSGAAGNLMGSVIVPGASGDIGAEPGFDMEGVFSRMEFNVERTFLMGTDEHDEPFLGIALKFSKPGNTPGFWRGKRFSYLVPAGLTPNSFNKNKFHRIYDPGENSKLKKKHFNGGGVETPGTSQERNNMMFYAFRPRMENVPIIADQELTEDVLTQGCSGDGCDWDVKRIGNFLEHTSYLFCKGASGEIQSNAGHISSSDEATSQESAIEDQVYPKVEVTENATGCLPTTSISVPDGVELNCDAEGIVEGDSVEVFSRQTVNRGSHTVDAVCGVEEGQESADLGGYGNVNYRLPKEAISRGGCFADWYDITTDAEIGGSTLQAGAYPTTLAKDESSVWSHSYNTNYNDGDGQNEKGGNIQNNRLAYERIKVRYNTSKVQNLTYRVSLEGVSSGRVTQGMIRTSVVNRTIIVEELPKSSKTIVREIVEDPESDARTLRQVVTTGENFSGQVRELVIDRSSQGGISINGITLTGFEGFPNQIAIRKIEISPVRNAAAYNQKYDWNSVANQDISGLNSTNTDLELRSVETYSEPRVCKGTTGIWQSRGKEVIEG